VTIFAACRDSELALIKDQVKQLLEIPSGDGSEMLQSLEPLVNSVRKFTQYYLQERTCPLPALLSALSTDLIPVREMIAQSNCPLADRILSVLKPCDTADYLKELARRVSHGHRSPAEIKETSLYEDQSAVALWRWEVSVSYPSMSFSSLQLALLPDDFPHLDEVKNAKADFSRVGKAVRAIFKVVSEVIKSASPSGAISGQDEVKINGLEDKVTAAMADIQKANEKKAALLKKKLSQEAETEKRLKRKEELAAAKAGKCSEDEASKKRPLSSEQVEVVDKEAPASDAPKKKLKQLGERELKELATIEKQKTMLLSFLQPPTPKTKTKAQSESPCVAPQCPSKSEGIEAPPNQDLSQSSLAPLPQFLNAELLTGFLKSPLSVKEIVLDNRKRYSSACLSYHKLPRKPRALSVTVTSPADSAWGESGANNYAEIKDVFVDSRKRLLSFAEDYRPAY
jgi:hypothetical protein